MAALLLLFLFGFDNRLPLNLNPTAFVRLLRRLPRPYFCCFSKLNLQGCMTFNSKDKASIKAVKAASFDGTGIGAVIDFVGNEATAAFADAVLRKGGKCVLN